MPERHPFAAVVSLRDRLTVAGTEELVRKVLAKEAPGAMLPVDWPLADAYRLPFDFVGTIRGFSVSGPFVWQWDSWLATH